MSAFKIKIKTWVGTLIIILAAIISLVAVFSFPFDDFSYDIVKLDIKKLGLNKVLFQESSYGPFRPPPPPPDIEKMKSQGCIADGFLSGHNGSVSKNIKLIKRVDCYYLHRALETWLEVPDFKYAAEVMDEVGKDDIVYGMFISEALDTKAELYYPDENRDFDFPSMCRKDIGDNYWGEHTCIPSLMRSEYKKYVKYITERAMDIGIQSFLFGQVFYQDQDLSNPKVDSVIESMRDYARFRKMEIVVGAQTNDIEDEEYLRLFDFIEGGVGVSPSGSVENGPCFSRWWKQEGDWCWALLWNERFSKKANDVFLHLDWSGKQGDDMSTFARMSREQREVTLKGLHDKFTSDGFGFLLPVIAVLPDSNGGCSGKKDRYYSADNRYSCKDEDAINSILKSGT